MAKWWLIAFVLLLGMEEITLPLTTMWLTWGALAAYYAAVCGLGIKTQLAIFASVSLLGI